jgi:hypothetical protein
VTAVVVLDLHGGLGALRQVRPFLYPIDEDLCWLEPADLGEVPEAVAAWLRRRGAFEYRLIVLLGLEPPVGDPFRASLALALHRLDRACLQELLRNRPAPAAIHALVLDGLERDAATGCPVHSEARLGWALDTRGFGPSEDPAGLLLDAADGRRLAEAWGGAIDLSGERNDGGLAGLNPTLREDLRSRLERVRQALDAILDGRLSVLRAARPDPGDDLRTLLEAGYRDIRAAMADDWRLLERAAPKLAAYDPDMALRRIAADHLGLLPGIRGIGLMLLEWLPTLGRIEPRTLLGLADLILLLARRPSRQEDVDRLLQDDSRAYAVTVRFDPAALASLFEDWRGRMRRALAELDRPEMAAEPARIPRYDGDACNSRASTPLPNGLDAQLRPWPVPWLRRPVQEPSWQEWRNATGATLGERRRQVDAALGRLGERLRLAAPRPETVEITDFAAEREARRTAFEAARSQLAQAAAPAPEPWEQRIRDPSRRLAALSAAQPSLGQVVGGFLAGAAVLASAWVAGPAVAASGPEDLWLPDAAAGLLAAAVLVPAWRSRQNIARLARECREAALDVDRQLRRMADARLDQLEKLCRLGMAARNQAEIERLDGEQRRLARLKDYHRRQLAAHLDALNAFAGPAAGEAPAAADAPLDPALPPARSRVYWPVPGQHGRDSVELAIGETRLRVEAPWIDAVEGFVLRPENLAALGRRTE